MSRIADTRSFAELNLMIFIGISLVGVGVYVVWLLNGDGDWALPMAATLGGAMVAGMVGEVVMSMLRKGDTTADVRDFEIRRYGMYVGHFVGVGGGVTALILAMLSFKTFFIAHALYVGFVLSALVSAGVRLRAYRNGLPR